MDPGSGSSAGAAEREGAKMAERDHSFAKGFVLTFGGGLAIGARRARGLVALGARLGRASRRRRRRRRQLRAARGARSTVGVACASVLHGAARGAALPTTGSRTAARSRTSATRRSREITTENVARAQGRLADAPAQLGGRREVLGREPAARVQGRHLRAHRRRRRLRRQRRDGPDPLAVQGEPRPDASAPSAAAGRAAASRSETGKVYIGQLDGKLVALDQMTGQRVWSTQVARLAQGLHDHERSAVRRRAA